MYGGETCCVGSSAISCCRNYDQVCARATGLCTDVCPTNTVPSADECCTAGQICVGGTCRTSCGETTCAPEGQGQTCCGNICCDTATQVCGSFGDCQARQTCTGTDVYIPPREFCCPQVAACGGNSACCDISLERCDTATGQCVSNP